MSRLHKVFHKQGERGPEASTGIAPAPTVTSVTPDSGSEDGGNPVTVEGTGFYSGATIKFDGVNATSVVFVDQTELTCDTPAGAVGTVDVQVINPDLQSDTLVGGYEYTPSS